MILNCNSCNKRFVVPDAAITSAGRLVQCGSCGTKWKQYPISNDEGKVFSNEISKNKKIPKNFNRKKKIKKKKREINLYSPEYLAKKHGISLNDEKIVKNSNVSKKVSFGFYNSLILFTVITITLSRVLYFFQDFIVYNAPITKYYLDYFFENIKNIFEIAKNLISKY